MTEVSREERKIVNRNRWSANCQTSTQFYVHFFWFFFFYFIKSIHNSIKHAPIASTARVCKIQLASSHRCHYVNRYFIKKHLSGHWSLHTCSENMKPNIDGRNCVCAGNDYCDLVFRLNHMPTYENLLNTQYDVMGNNFKY